MMRDETDGAGRSGGLLFLVVLAVVAYVAVTTLDGWPRWVAFAVLVFAAAGMAVDVLRRK